MATTKLPFQARRKVAALNQKRKKYGKIEQKSSPQDALEVALVLEGDIKLIHPIVKQLLYKKFYQTFPW